MSTGRNFDDRAGFGVQELFLELLLVGRVVSRQGLRRGSTAAAGGKSTQKSDSDFAHGYLPISRKSPVTLSIAWPRDLILQAISAHGAARPKVAIRNMPSGAANLSVPHERPGGIGSFRSPRAM